jgi:UTP--glucose-1-phosphate uridylyltransferase
VGDNPFVVLLGDEFMDTTSTLLPDMMRIHDQYGRSVLALQEVEPEPRSSATAAPSPSASPTTSCRSSTSSRSPSRRSAPSNLAVMGRYIFTPEIFDKLEQVTPGVGGEIQLTDAIAMLIADQAVYGVTFEGGSPRHRHRPRLPGDHRGAGPQPGRHRARLRHLPGRPVSSPGPRLIRAASRS